MRDGPIGELHWLGVAAAAEAIAAKDLSPVELLAALLKRIDGLDPRLNAFIKLDREAALQAAKARRARSWAAPPPRALPTAKKPSSELKLCAPCSPASRACRIGAWRRN